MQKNFQCLLQPLIARVDLSIVEPRHEVTMKLKFVSPYDIPSFGLAAFNWASKHESHCCCGQKPMKSPVSSKSFLKAWITHISPSQQHTSKNSAGKDSSSQSTWKPVKEQLRRRKNSCFPSFQKKILYFFNVHQVKQNPTVVLSKTPDYGLVCFETVRSPDQQSPCRETAFAVPTTFDHPGKMKPQSSFGDQVRLHSWEHPRGSTPSKSLRCKLRWVFRDFLRSPLDPPCFLAVFSSPHWRTLGLDPQQQFSLRLNGEGLQRNLQTSKACTSRVSNSLGSLGVNGGLWSFGLLSYCTEPAENKFLSCLRQVQQGQPSSHPRFLSNRPSWTLFAG